MRGKAHTVISTAIFSCSNARILFSPRQFSTADFFSSSIRSSYYRERPRAFRPQENSLSGDPPGFLHQDLEFRFSHISHTCRWRE